ncbi:MAG: hypothetical protein WDN31_17500 [Hyphomicrobium sp.]
MHRVLGSAVSLLLLTVAAHALMAPEIYRKARAEAAYHVQLAITKVDAPRQGPGGCLVEGQVLKVFKDAGGKISPDQTISFPVACYRRGDAEFPHRGHAVARHRPAGEGRLYGGLPQRGRGGLCAGLVELSADPEAVRNSADPVE